MSFRGSAPDARPPRNAHGTAETALPFGVPVDYGNERVGVEVEPQGLGKVKLRVRQLPDQEIADPLFPSGADEQIGLGGEIHREERREFVLGVSRALIRKLPDHLFHRLQDVPASAVVGRDGQRQTLVAAGERLCFRGKAGDPLPERAYVTYQLEPDAVGVELFGFLFQRIEKQLPENRDLLGGAAPVLRAESKERQVLDTLIDAGAGRFAHRLDAAPVAVFRQEAAAASVAAVRMRVADTGMGIKPEDMALLFTPFRQIDSTLSRNHEGTGLGLAICRRLAALMGGTIEAESRWGEGSVFAVTLPLNPQAERESS